jgi:hypothetical protein
MKTTIYTCDNGCDSETEDLEHSKWIEIGSENHSLFVNNNLENRRVSHMHEYGSVHFCSLECFTEFFVKTT